MNSNDISKAKSLSKAIAGLGLKPLYKYGAQKPKVVKQTSKIRTPFKFNYDALTVKDGKAGKDGRTPTTDEILALIKPLVKHSLAEIGTPEMEITDDVVKAIVQKMHSLPEQDKLEVSKGIRNFQSFVYKGTKYGIEEMMHGGGSSSSSSGYQQPTSGIVNGINQIFVWATAPSVIVVDQGRPMQKVSSDGTVNWTGTTTTTLTIAPNFDVFATA